jgi:hypothetical protein
MAPESGFLRMHPPPCRPRGTLCIIILPRCVHNPHTPALLGPHPELTPNFSFRILPNSKPKLLLTLRTLNPLVLNVERTRACTMTSASSARGSRPGNRRISGLRDPPAIVERVLLPARRRTHVHALGDGIEGLRRRTAGVGYPCAIACSRLRSTTPILQASAARKKWETMRRRRMTCG